MAKTLDSMGLKQIIRLHLDGLSNREICKTLGIGRNAVNEYMQRFTVCEKTMKELLQLELEQAKQNLEVLSSSFPLTKIKIEGNQKELKIKTPFNICVLGEVSDTAQIRNELNNYFEKVGIKATDWKIEFFNNTKLQNINVLKSLQKGQSKFSFIVTGQIFHHSGKGNTKANIISELKNEKYVPHLIGSSPKDILTPDKLITVIDEYIN